ncbi:hypothetical protein C491_02690 [Natronococcus amylolyticus DSM 10524]|uniref:Uncharacterized protein n=1 Tax=Natronococcus amylolyticus DSM 10524 TaxID=1227497 RepID=L9XEK6_9EURY|nr:hypothetical protein [Natronococcus amylolyticus]ELY60170.1 hypothetical protein C491_02690 [Natronococcus amylolyticus DSM 10524]
MESGRQFRLANLVLGTGVIVYGAISALRDGLGIWTGLFLICGLGLVAYHIRKPTDATQDVSDRNARIATGCAALFVLAAAVLLL